MYYIYIVNIMCIYKHIMYTLMLSLSLSLSLYIYIYICIRGIYIYIYIYIYISGAHSKPPDSAWLQPRLQAK